MEAAARPHVGLASVQVQFSFATTNEDALVEMQLIESLSAAKSTKEKSLRVACVTGCGTTSIAMAAMPEVHCIDAIDKMPEQVMVAALQGAAVAALETPAQFECFVGGSGSDEARIEMYSKHVRAHLPSEAAQYWDAHLAMLSAGLLRCGGCERQWALIRAELPSTEASELSAQPEAVTAAIDRAVTVHSLTENIKFMPPEHVPALRPTILKMFDDGFQAMLSEYCETGIARWLLHFYLTGGYALEGDSCPVFLKPQTYAAARAHGCTAPRVRFHAGLIQDKAAELAELHGAYDLISLSNILQADRENAVQTVQAVLPALAPRGVLLCRGSGTVDYFEQCGLTVDTELSGKLKSLDVPHWEEVVVACKA